ncbi:hypothetical protein llap_4796 [Limosa lapponica baueri]|uniref:Uncharacterized protein n=1 Tax=Limosa lapponica baueri TaxID=1758121 RepID=A0A2I0UFS5_LIMLA|nr:hypothetical protein llap_4796 [Limosa lapponica baueri]
MLKRKSSRTGLVMLFGTGKGVLGAPFLTEESANQFIRLKRQIPYSQNYWDPSSSQNAWGYTLAEQVTESWTSLRDTAQYYMDLGSFAFDPSVARYDGVSQQSIS